MLRKRIIFSLIYADGFFNQSRNFRLQKVGNLTWLEKNYKFQNIAFSLDELVIVNASRNQKDITLFGKTVSQVVDDVFIPVAAGGGIRSIKDAEVLFENGADKVILNSVLYNDHKVVKDIIRNYGTQSVVASVDYKLLDGKQKVLINDGTTVLKTELSDYLVYLEDLNVGEIYLNSIDRDGTGFGYDIATIENCTQMIKTPLIIAGGAGNEKHLKHGLSLSGVNAVATANLFNFVGDGLPKARKAIIDAGENIANWSKI